jgi:hypothetical protein
MGVTHHSCAVRRRLVATSFGAASAPRQLPAATAPRDRADRVAGQVDRFRNPSFSRMFARWRSTGFFEMTASRRLLALCPADGLGRSLSRGAAMCHSERAYPPRRTALARERSSRSRRGRQHALHAGSSRAFCRRRPGRGAGSGRQRRRSGHSAFEMQQNASRDSWNFEQTETPATDHARHPRRLTRRPARRTHGPGTLAAANKRVFSAEPRRCWPTG